MFTGTSMKVVYSGCNWNSVVFQMDQTQAEFENWLGQVWEKFQEIVRADPAKYKVTSRRGPGFPAFIVTMSRDPEMYPNELRCRLSTTRDANGESISNAVLLSGGVKIEPSQVWSGGYMTPVFRMGYYKNGDDFGLSLTILKADYTPSEQVRTMNQDWMIDVEENTSGSDSSSAMTI